MGCHRSIRKYSFITLTQLSSEKDGEHLTVVCFCVWLVYTTKRPDILVCLCFPSIPTASPLSSFTVSVVCTSAQVSITRRSLQQCITNRNLAWPSSMPYNIQGEMHEKQQHMLTCTNTLRFCPYKLVHTQRESRIPNIQLGATQQLAC